jgi:hypothetical protein
VGDDPLASPAAEGGMSKSAPIRLKYDKPAGRMPTLQFVRPSEIRVDPTYQRCLEGSASQTLIKRMAQRWNWDLCQPLVLARRTDFVERLFVIDGQHRLAAARLREDIEQLPCVIVSYGSPAEEAASFVSFNQQRRPLSKLDLFRAAVAAQNPEALSIAQGMKAAGLSLAPHSNSNTWQPGMVMNISGIERAWRTHGPLVATTAMKLLAKAYPAEILRYGGSIFPGALALAIDAHIDDGGSERFWETAKFIGARPQQDWYRAISARSTEIPTLVRAAMAVFRDAWAMRATERDELPDKPTAPLLAEVTTQKSWCDQCEALTSVRAAVLCKSVFCPKRPRLRA